ncbi:hypothetical protein PHYPSEUDO_014632 [Phytophthora pseudosyringae]|uniref:Uncharacterized protein n=1 Tax=Phytophthora pseudosyringae TaxID=221518 RepID=A0A8T1V4R3_9STRA|nr:hypothetical protein PHYPSEUDO_014632 [Phytophthora pseudosyringae]
MQRQATEEVLPTTGARDDEQCEAVAEELTKRTGDTATSEPALASTAAIPEGVRVTRMHAESQSQRADLNTAGNAVETARTTEMVAERERESDVGRAPGAADHHAKRSSKQLSKSKTKTAGDISNSRKTVPPRANTTGASRGAATVSPNTPT